MAAAGMYGIDVSPESLKSEGGSSSKRSRNQSDFSPVPGEDKEYLGVRRIIGLGHLRRLCYALIIFSCLAIIIGLISLARSAPEFRFPYAYGGPCIAGVLCIVSALLNLWLAKEGGKTPAGEATTDCFRCINTCQCMYSILPVMACVYGGVAEGMIGYIECIKIIEHHQDTTQMHCTPNTEELAVLSIATIIVCLILAILTIATSTLCCCYRRAFGIHSGYEVLMDVQTEKIEQTSTKFSAIQHDPSLRTYAQDELAKHKDKQIQEEAVVKAEIKETAKPYAKNDQSHIKSGGNKVDYQSHHTIERNPAFIEVECSEKRVLKTSPEVNYNSQDQMTERLITSTVDIQSVVTT